jgi:hypothetical protein
MSYSCASNAKANLLRKERLPAALPQSFGPFPRPAAAASRPCQGGFNYYRSAKDDSSLNTTQQ